MFLARDLGNGVERRDRGDQHADKTVNTHPGLRVVTDGWQVDVADLLAEVRKVRLAREGPREEVVQMQTVRLGRQDRSSAAHEEETFPQGRSSGRL